MIAAPEAGEGPFQPVNPEPVDQPSPYQVHIFMLDDAEAEAAAILPGALSRQGAYEFQCAGGLHGPCGTVTTVMWVRASMARDSDAMLSVLEESIGLAEMLRSLAPEAETEAPDQPPTKVAAAE